MNSSRVLESLRFFMTESEISRVTVQEMKSGEVNVRIDLHEMRKYEASRFINNIINAIRTPFSLAVIHGYNHGTVLRTYVNEELKNDRIRECHISSKNQGMTLMNIA